MKQANECGQFDWTASGHRTQRDDEYLEPRVGRLQVECCRVEGRGGSSAGTGPAERRAEREGVRPNKTGLNPLLALLAVPAPSPAHSQRKGSITRTA